MLELVFSAILQGLSQAFGERLLNNKSRTVEAPVVLKEIERLKATHAETVIDVKEVMTLLQTTIDRVDGLQMTHGSISFSPSKQSPTLGDALMSLDEEIENMYAAPEGQESRPSPRGNATGHSILDGLDAEIEGLRAASRESDR